MAGVSFDAVARHCDYLAGRTPTRTRQRVHRVIEGCRFAQGDHRPWQEIPF